jgi:hypothetical protein
MYLVVENKSVKNLCLSLLPTLCRLATGDSQAVKKIILTKFDVVDFQIGAGQGERQGGAGQDVQQGDADHDPRLPLYPGEQQDQSSGDLRGPVPDRSVDQARPRRQYFLLDAGVHPVPGHTRVEHARGELAPKAPFALFPRPQDEDALQHVPGRRWRQRVVYRVEGKDAQGFQ